MVTETIGYQREYTIQRVASGKRGLKVTFPYEFAEREARSRGMTVDELLAKVNVLVDFNGPGDGVKYTFKDKETVKKQL